MFRKVTVFILLASFLVQGMILPQSVRAQAVLNLPVPGSMVMTSSSWQPMMIKGITIHPDNPLQFDFLVSKGDSTDFQEDDTDSKLRQESQRLIKYFLACLAIPENDLWVNLSPYEKDRMIPDALGKTELGRDLLAQDYILKQLTASMIYPEKDLGKEFWDKVYTKAQQMYGTTQIPVNTFNKVWILADTAKVFEKDNTAFVVNAHLKVMLDEDYEAFNRNNKKAESQGQTEQQKALGITTKNGAELSSQIIREIVIPEIEREINTGKNFATIRQIFHAFILASWYKKNLKQSILNQYYSNKNKIAGMEYETPIRGHVPIEKTKNVSPSTVPTSHPTKVKASQGNTLTPNEIYQQYLAAYKKGVFNYIKEDLVDTTGRSSLQSIPRKYFSGGTKFDSVQITLITDTKQLTLTDREQFSDVDFSIMTNLEPSSKDTSKPNAAMAINRTISSPNSNFSPSTPSKNKLKFLDRLGWSFPLLNGKLKVNFPKQGKDMRIVVIGPGSDAGDLQDVLSFYPLAKEIEVIDPADLSPQIEDIRKEYKVANTPNITFHPHSILEMKDRIQNADMVIAFRVFDEPYFQAEKLSQANDIIYGMMKTGAILMANYSSGSGGYTGDWLNRKNFRVHLLKGEASAESGLIVAIKREKTDTEALSDQVITSDDLSNPAMTAKAIRFVDFNSQQEVKLERLPYFLVDAGRNPQTMMVSSLPNGQARLGWFKVPLDYTDEDVVNPERGYRDVYDLLSFFDPFAEENLQKAVLKASNLDIDKFLKGEHVLLVGAGKNLGEATRLIKLAPGIQSIVIVDIDSRNFIFNIEALSQLEESLRKKIVLVRANITQLPKLIKNLNKGPFKLVYGNNVFVSELMEEFTVPVEEAIQQLVKPSGILAGKIGIRFSGKFRKTFQDLYMSYPFYSYRKIDSAMNNAAMSAQQWQQVLKGDIFAGAENMGSFDLALKLKKPDVTSLPPWFQIEALGMKDERLRQISNKGYEELSPKTKEYLQLFPQLPLDPEMFAEIRAYLYGWDHHHEPLKIAGHTIDIQGHEKHPKIMAILLDWTLWNLAGVDPKSPEGEKLAKVYLSRVFPGLDQLGQKRVHFDIQVPDDAEKGQARKIVEAEEKEFIQALKSDESLRKTYKDIVSASWKWMFLDYLYRGNLNSILGGMGDQHEYSSVLPFSHLVTDIESPIPKKDLLQPFNRNEFAYYSMGFFMPYRLRDLITQGKKAPAIVDDFWKNMKQRRYVITQWHTQLIYDALSAAASQGMEEANSIWEEFRQSLVRKGLVNLNPRQELVELIKKIRVEDRFFDQGSRNRYGFWKVLDSIEKLKERVKILESLGDVNIAEFKEFLNSEAPILEDYFIHVQAERHGFRFATHKSGVEGFSREERKLIEFAGREGLIGITWPQEFSPQELERNNKEIITTEGRIVSQLSNFDEESLLRDVHMVHVAAGVLTFEKIETREFIKNLPRIAKTQRGIWFLHRIINQEDGQTTHLLVLRTPLFKENTYIIRLVRQDAAMSVEQQQEERLAEATWSLIHGKTMIGINRTKIFDNLEYIKSLYEFQYIQSHYSGKPLELENNIRIGKNQLTLRNLPGVRNFLKQEMFTVLLPQEVIKAEDALEKFRKALTDMKDTKDVKNFEKQLDVLRAMKNVLVPLQTMIEKSQTEFGEQVKEETDYFKKIIFRLKNRIDVAEGRINPEDRVDIDLLEQTLINRAELSGVKFNIPSNVSKMEIKGNQMRWEDALQNLLYNAVQSSIRRKEDRKDIEDIEIVCDMKLNEEGSLVITITDNGEGFTTPEALEGLKFDPILMRQNLFTLGFSTKKNEGGTGFGLNVAYNVFEGNIQAQNRPEGGAEFIITLPISNPAMASLADRNHPQIWEEAISAIRERFNQLKDLEMMSVVMIFNANGQVIWGADDYNRSHESIATQLLLRNGPQGGYTGIRIVSNNTNKSILIQPSGDRRLNIGFYRNSEFFGLDIQKLPRPDEDYFKNEYTNRFFQRQVYRAAKLLVESNEQIANYEIILMKELFGKGRMVSVKEFLDTYKYLDINAAMTAEPQFSSIASGVVNQFDQSVLIPLHINPEVFLTVKKRRLRNEFAVTLFSGSSFRLSSVRIEGNLEQVAFILSRIKDQDKRDILEHPNNLLSILAAIYKRETALINEAISRDHGLKDKDAAMEANGGIDLKASDLKMNVQKQGTGIQMNIDPAMMEQFKSDTFTGIEPVIIKITPIQGAWASLGLAPPQEITQLAGV